MEIIPPAELVALRQWFIWRYQDREGSKPTKVPYTCQGFKADVTNPDHWSTFEYASTALSRRGFADGLGWVFSASDGLCGIDLDDCLPEAAERATTWAAGILNRFGDCYMEESPSGSGVKIWCRARAPRCGRWVIGAGAIEVYDRERFFAVTGHSNGVASIADHQRDVEALVANLDQDGHYEPRVIPARIPRGQRHKTLVSLAGTNWRRGVCADAIEALLLAVNEKQCDPPHTAEHIRRIVASAEKWRRR
jgi:primase-polymerase (primpol)-like protein